METVGGGDDTYGGANEEGYYDLYLYLNWQDSQDAFNE